MPSVEPSDPTTGQAQAPSGGTWNKQLIMKGPNSSHYGMDPTNGTSTTQIDRFNFSHSCPLKKKKKQFSNAPQLPVLGLPVSSQSRPFVVPLCGKTVPALGTVITSRYSTPPSSMSTLGCERFQRGNCRTAYLSHGASHRHWRHRQHARRSLLKSLRHHK